MNKHFIFKLNKKCKKKFLLFINNMYKLLYYQSKYNNCAPQGSTEWLEGRSFSFGGSEMATLLGKNKYQKKDALFKQKQERTNIKSEVMTWGVLFEPVAKLYIQREHGTVYEFGSIPHSYYPICYSPDGLLVKNNDLLLLEIKCPMMRGISKIPEAYILQVQTGMNVINVNYCLFSQFRFRRCKYGTSTLNCTYDRDYHKEYRKRCADQFPVSYGFLWWDTADEPMVDLALDKTMMDKVIHLPKPKIILEESFSETHGLVLQWKLFEIVYASIKPDKTFLNTKEEMLWTAYKQLTENSQSKLN